MEAKLRSISKLIPWSLTVKTLVFALAWWILPYGLFLVVAAYLYLSPLFKPLKFLLPFLTLLLLMASFFWTKDFWLVVWGSAIFFSILGVRDLLFVKRRVIYRTAHYALFFLMFLTFFSNFQKGIIWPAILGSLVLAGFFFWLLKNLVDYEDSLEVRDRFGRRKEFIVEGLTAFFIWQFSWTLLFLPLNYAYQTMFGFLTALVFSELILAYLNFELTRRKILMNFTILFIFAVFTLASFSAGI